MEYSTPVTKNLWISRARKFLIVTATAIVEIAAVYTNGPEWFYPLATAVGALLTYFVPNAPEYRDR